jgi:hypothetical protein
MINNKNKNITEVKIGDKIITYIYHKMKLIYEAISSCFGKGFWVNNSPFNNNDAWKNN